MIRRPDASEFRDRAAIAALREAGEAADHFSRPARRFGREWVRMAFWSHGVPLALCAAFYVLSRRWPDIFLTVWAHYALVGVFGWFAWKHLGAPAANARAKSQLDRVGGLEDTAALRSGLEAQWRKRGNER